MAEKPGAYSLEIEPTLKGAQAAGHEIKFKQGLGRGEALRQVKLAMLKRRNRHHPLYWASFIQSGEWAGLDEKR